MGENLGTILGRLGRTAVLCIGLGLLLYGAMAALAELPYGRWLIGLVLAAPMAVLVAFLVIDALRSGVFPMRFRSARRDAEPFAFWFNIAWFGACGLALAALALWCAGELHAALTA